ncbi:hypothetical protein [Microbacterium sp. NPDC055683]
MKHRITVIAAGILIALGASAITVSAAAPELTEQAAGEVKIAVQEAVETARQQAAEAVTGEEQPVVTLRLEGSASSQVELDTAPPGAFVWMESYGESVIETWAAHNLFGGDRALGLAVGDLVELEGERAGLYRVVEVRDVRKVSDVSELDGMRGELALQTCPYDDPSRMRVVGLEQVEG